jgi:hypothetical protein
VLLKMLLFQLFFKLCWGFLVTCNYFDVFHPVVYINNVKWYKTLVLHNYLLKQH